MIPPSIAAFASRIGLTGLAIAILVALLAVQTIRLEGFKLWPISIEGARTKAERLESELLGVIQAQKKAGEAQRAVNDAKQQDYRDDAKESEHDKKITDIAVRDAVSRYADAHRVRPSGGSCPSSGAGSPAESGGAGLDQGVPPDSGVFVSEPDLRKLSDATGYAVACRRLVLDLAD